MHFVCVLFLISWTAYYQRRLRRVFPVIWKDSVEDTGNTALESHFFFFCRNRKKIKNKKRKRKKKTFFKLLARWSPTWPVSWAACHPVHYCYPVSGRMLFTRQTPLVAPCPRRPPLALLRVHPCVACCSTVATEPRHSHLLDNVGLGQQRWSSSHKHLQ